MFDWNRDGQIDAVNIDIWFGDDDDSPPTVDLEGYTFYFIQELEPKRNFWGSIKQFTPQATFFEKNQKPLHEYGHGSFCKFSLNSSSYYGAKGVYAMFDREYLLYIGKTKNLVKRINYDYGSINAKDCYAGSPEINCKINSLILHKYLNEEKIFLAFFATDEYDTIAEELIYSLHPPVNWI